jgi:ribose/xylose/arabinose/galactoside ABC-type transport system permease subunit
VNETAVAEDPVPTAVQDEETHAAGDRRGRRRLRLSGNAELQLLIAVVAIAVIFSVLYPDTFATHRNLTNMAAVGGILLVVAIGQSIALLVGGFDLSVAANMGFVSIVASLHMTHGNSVASAIALGLLAGAAVGLVNGIMIAVLRITPFVATLATLTFLGGYANQLSGGQSVAGLPSSFSSFGGQTNWWGIPSAVGIAAIVIFIAWVLLRRTRLGLYIYAIGGSRETARVSGVPVARYEVAAYVLCGLFAGLAGLMLASRVTVGQDTLGNGYDLLSIATAVIGGVAIGGGVGRLSGVLLGVATLTVLTTGLDIAGLNEFVKQMVTGGLLVVAVLASQARGARLSSIKRALASVRTVRRK